MLACMDLIAIGILLLPVYFFQIFIHQGAHFVVGALQGLRIRKFRVLPARLNRRWSLTQLDWGFPGGWQDRPIKVVLRYLAPLIVGLAALTLYLRGWVYYPNELCLVLALAQSLDVGWYLSRPARPTNDWMRVCRAFGVTVERARQIGRAAGGLLVGIVVGFVFWTWP